jgi:uncharacterized membrane protein
LSICIIRRHALEQGNRMDRMTLGYWITTGIFCLTFAGGGLAHFTHQPMMAEAMEKLGYPAYVMTILGSAKLLGVIALLSPGRPLLKEWAYAGFAFDLLGANASHFFASDPVGEFVGPLALLVVGAASYLLRPESRRLPQSVRAFA